MGVHLVEVGKRAKEAAILKNASKRANVATSLGGLLTQGRSAMFGKGNTYVVRQHQKFLQLRGWKLLREPYR